MTQKFKNLTISIILVLIICLGPLRAATPLPVVASFSILGDMVREVGGDNVAVTTLVGPDGDAHAFQPTPKHLKQITQAKIVFVNGLGFEGWLERAIPAAQFTGTVVVASQGIKPRQMNEDGAIITDPHAWQDLSNGVIYVRNIAAALKTALPEHAASIQSRADAYVAQLETKHKETLAAFSAIPSQKRVVITSHDAFGYFGSAYGIRFESPVGLSTESEASAKTIVKLVQQMRREKIKTVFLENMSSERLAQQLAAEANAKLGGTLYADALSAPSGAAPTYLGMFDNNVPKLLAAMRE